VAALGLRSSWEHTDNYENAMICLNCGMPRVPSIMITASLNIAWQTHNWSRRKLIGLSYVSRFYSYSYYYVVFSLWNCHPLIRRPSSCRSGVSFHLKHINHCYGRYQRPKNALNNGRVRTARVGHGRREHTRSEEKKLILRRQIWVRRQKPIDLLLSVEQLSLS